MYLHQISILLVAIMVLSVYPAQSKEEDELDSNLQEISNFLIGLISEYDTSGKGAIPVQRYPEFLAKVFLNGHLSHSKDQISTQTLSLLNQATLQFSSKYKDIEEVGLQEFYMDMIKQFTQFLQLKEVQYSNLLSIFYSDAEPSLVEEKIQLQENEVEGNSNRAQL